MMDKEKVTFSHCVPTILHMLLNSPAIKDVDLSGWKVIIGGSALPKAMCLAAMKRGVDIFTGYGLSETCPVLTLALLSSEMMELPADQQADLRIKAGRPVGFVDIKLVDANMNDVPHDGESTGELTIRAPWLTQGYHKDNHNSEELWRGGYLHTGDVATINELGFVKITDRMKDIIKIGGEWVSSLELEDIITQYPSVSEVAVIGTTDDKWGERPLALIVIKPDDVAKTTKKSIMNHTMDFVKKGIMARENLLLKIQFVEAIDKTSVGKIDKKVLRQKYA
jgi:fatty-acyl-CoA synthase